MGIESARGAGGRLAVALHRVSESWGYEGGYEATTMAGLIVSDEDLGGDLLHGVSDARAPVDK